MSKNEANEAPDSPRAGELNRRDLLVKAGVVGAGAIAAGSLAGGAKAATRRTRATPIKRGGHLTWALESDPVHVAPFGQILTAGHWGKEFTYDSLVEWDKNLNVKPALAASYKIVSKTEILWNLKKGIKFHNGKELTADDVVYSVKKMLNPPLPGSISTVAQVPAIAGRTDRLEVRGAAAAEAARRPHHRVLRLGSLRTDRPRGPLRERAQRLPERDRHRPVPDDRASTRTTASSSTANQSFWKTGQPYMDAITLKTMTDEQARVAALRAGAIDGATLSVDVARSLANVSDLIVLKGPNAAFRELQMTLHPGEKQAWHDKRVRQAVNHAINRADIIQRIYSGEAEYSGHVPPGYGPWPLTDAELKQKYLKFDLPAAKKLMADAGYAKGFSVTMTTFASGDYPQVSAVVQSHLKAINIDVNIVAQEAGTFAANNGAGKFDWDVTGRGMRGDVDGYVAEFHPAAPVFKIWYPEYKSVKAWRGIGNGRIQLDPAKRLPIYKAAQRELLLDPVQVPLVAIKKYQVVRKRVQGMYVAFSDFNTGLRTVWLNG